MSLTDPFEVNRRLVAHRPALPTATRVEVDVVTAGVGDVDLAAAVTEILLVDSGSVSP